MSPFGHSFSAGSPVMALPPQPAHQASFSMDPFSPQATPFGQPAAFQRCPAPPAMPAGSLRVAGRKRSRDEAAPNLVTDEPEHHTAPKEPEEEWEYGPGMVLIKKGSYVADAGSQSGTWVEEKAAQDDARKTQEAITRLHEQQERPSLRSNKSQRLTQAVMPNLHAAQPATASTSTTLSSESSAQPIVDQFTLHLGIGWRRISEDQHIQAAARGWARFIENHYPVSNAIIRLESKGLQSYLVEAAEGFFLFAENLRQGRFVSRDVEGAMRNLQCSPPTFDGQETLLATESPAAVEPANMMEADSNMVM
ncbi:hypothetical protein CPAR01_06091 [Colletotrichum paranaense]|uniref:Uncharacterized protein n=4 Tax=Colletotrichum acutatum species complex TaxID=2707335 RepID=A0A9Q8SBB8_9PEZI|nr:uncharacterized protein CLUP02_00925 [Colletotrichum lupini]XP_060351831.1 uncharacterized protein CPAR01_06091 [Colletotrichum paranaense]KAK0374006.1 hypothetical protein CLIM01_08633 [Colletotrichum limetticola]KAK1459152.1 hypothetical protein CMEL01_02151 [Colletotrichum melonis]KAK1542704.1 hypothetical protein CPAR01_06091 [Colletotrichum paranaense]KAK1719897.1 hypothetical protein BDP67DRAFT_392342 [Colletotrichum lupini]UQC74277.1 hypothetical protein CLUP02_00925 [Colletotrichum